MAHDREILAALGLWRLQGDDYYILSYPPTRRATIATEFILDFKKNNEEAVGIAKQFYLRAAKEIEGALKEFDNTYVVAIPTSKVGKINVPCERMCEAIALEVKSVRHIPFALRRIKTVPKSAYAAPHERPTFEDHRESIEYAGRLQDKKSSVIMIDDVITQGNVSNACRDILISGIGCKRVIGVFLGRTE